MYDFTYHRPDSLEEALRLMRTAADGKFLAGGMTLVPTLKQRLASPDVVIDLANVAPAGISGDGQTLTIGAGVSHADVAANETVKRLIPALARQAGGIGDPHVRNRGTLGGSIANNDPAADYPAALLALDAVVETNERNLPADAFFTGMFETALTEDEIVLSVTFNVPCRAAYARFDNPASHYAMAAAFVADFGSGNVRVAVTGAGPSVFRHAEAETALARQFSPEALQDIKTPADDMTSDMHAAADYRAHLVDVMIRRAVKEMTT